MAAQENGELQRTSGAKEGVPRPIRVTNSQTISNQAADGASTGSRMLIIPSKFHLFIKKWFFFFTALCLLIKG